MVTKRTDDVDFTSGYHTRDQAAPSETKTFYVGKHGNDSNDGESILNAKLTITAAEAAAFATSLSSGNRAVVVVLDAATYQEDVTIRSYITLFAPNATIQGVNADALTLNANAEAHVRKVLDVGFFGVPTVTLAGDDNKIVADYVRNQGGNGGPALRKTTGTGESYAMIRDKVEVGPDSIGVFCNQGTFEIDINYMELSFAGFVGTVGIGGGVPGNNHTIVGRVNHIHSTGSGAVYGVSTTTTAAYTVNYDLSITTITMTSSGNKGFNMPRPSNTGNSITAKVAYMNCATAYDIQEGIFSLLVTSLTGAETVGGPTGVDTPNVHVTKAGHPEWHDVQQGFKEDFLNDGSGATSPSIRSLYLHEIQFKAQRIASMTGAIGVVVQTLSTGLPGPPFMGWRQKLNTFDSQQTQFKARIKWNKINVTGLTGVSFIRVGLSHPSGVHAFFKSRVFNGSYDNWRFVLGGIGASWATILSPARNPKDDGATGIWHDFEIETDGTGARFWYDRGRTTESKGRQSAGPGGFPQKYLKVESLMRADIADILMFHDLIMAQDKSTW